MPITRVFKHAKRPAGVTLIAIVQAVNALSIAGLLLLSELVDDVTVEVSEPLGISVGVFVALGLVTAAGLWFLQRWAWVLTMLWAGLVLLTNLYAYATDEPVSYFSMALTLVQVLYLNMTEVQEAFERQPRPHRSREAHYG